MYVYGLGDLSYAVNACVPQIHVSVCSQVPGAYFTTGGEACASAKEKKISYTFFSKKKAAKSLQMASLSSP